MNESRDLDGRPQPSQSVGGALKAIGWGFLGIRKGSGQHQDAARVKPLHLIAVALAVVIAFVLVLMAVVHFVVQT